MLIAMENSEAAGEFPCLLRFSQNETLLFAFPCRDERKFSAFARGQAVTPALGGGHQYQSGDGVSFRRTALAVAVLGSQPGLRTDYNGFPELYQDIKVTALLAKRSSIKAKVLWKDNQDRLFRLLVVCVLLGLMLMITGVMSWGMPGWAFVAGPADFGEDCELVVENRWLTSRIYVMQDEDVQGIYQENRLSRGRERQIVRVAASGEHIYFLRTLDDGLDWELVGLEKGKTETLCEGTFEQAMNVTGLRVQRNTIYITAVGENEAVLSMSMRARM